MAKKVTKREGIKTFVGVRINPRQYKRFLAGAKTPAERAAIKSFVLGDDPQYFGKDTTADGDVAE